MHSDIPGRRQQGAVIVTAAFLLLFLLGFVGFALDFGHLFVVKSELQTAVDSCALAAAQELDGINEQARDRAINAGLAAGNLNRVNMQSSAWGGIVAGDITFRDAGYAPTNSGVAARYVQCQHTQVGIPTWLIKAMGAFSGSAGTYPTVQNVMASAVASRASAQTTCPLPLALKPKPGGTAPNYGFTVGEWITLINEQNAARGGQIGWANLDGSNNASETEDEVNGYCGTRVGDTLGTPGVQTSVADAWNARFGIYKNNSGPNMNPPDYTGYGYTATNWPTRQNAYDDFVAKRQAYASCANTGTRVKGANSCESITGLTLNGGFQSLATSGSTGEHRQFGTNRRIVTVPIVNGAMQVVDYACMLMLQPLSVPMSSAYLEYRGNASDAGSPCVTNGIPGGTSGPMVPVLVR